MARLAVVVALCGVIIASVADASPLRTCPSTCFCRHTLTVNKADCKDIPEWDLKTSDAQVVRIMPPPHPIPSSPLILSRLDMFPKVQMLSVTNRSIVELTSGNLPTLQVLDLSNNKISRFNDGTFHHMPVLRQLNLAGNPISLKRGIPLLKSSSIRTLDLGYSGLTHIPDGSLGGIPNLTSLYLLGNPLKLLENVPLVDRISIQELDLSYCKLTRVPNHSLDNLVNLQRLYLKGNDLKTISVGTLPVNLHYLDLSANRIRDVPVSPLSTLKNLTNLELAKNPVKCTCELITFLDRMSEQNVISEKMVVCAEPVKYAKLAWKDIDERELCKDDVTSEESTDSSSDDDASSASVSFERDDLSYETDGPPEEENQIMSQHPPPLSLQKLLQKPTRYQNMEENSIQSDQPYSNTSDEGAEHMNDSPATTVQTISQSHEDTDDDLIVVSGAEPDDSGKHITTSTEVSSKDIPNAEHTEVSMGGEDDRLVIPVSTAIEDEVGTSTESQDKHADTDHMEVNDSTEEKEKDMRIETTPQTLSLENSHTAGERENLENEKQQEEDIAIAPDASVAVDEQTETPRKSTESSEESTENPDAETFMRNEETIAMGKMMPESNRETDNGIEHSSKAEENVQDPVILASQSEGQAEDGTESEGDLFHTVSTPSSAEEQTSPPPDENSRESGTSQSLSEEVSSTSEGTDTEQKETERTTTDLSVHHESVVTLAEETPEKLQGSVHAFAEETVTEPPSKLGLVTETNPYSDMESKKDLEREFETDIAPMSAAKIESEEPTVKPTPSGSAENALENGEFGTTETKHDLSEEISVGLEVAQTHSDSNTEHAEANTEPAIPESETQENLNKDVTPGTEASDEHEHSEEHNEMTESALAVTEGDTPLVHEKSKLPDPSSSTNTFDAQIAAIAPSSTDLHEMTLETTTPKAETHREESNSGSFFPFSFFPSSGSDIDHNHVSEPSGSSNNQDTEPSGSSNDQDSEPLVSSDDRVSGLPSERSYDAVGNNSARMSGSEDVVAVEDDGVHIATMAYVVIAGVIVCIIIAIACVSLRSRPDKKRKGSAPVRIRGDNVSPGTEMKDMMNPLLEPIAEGQTANEFHDDPARRPSLVSLELNGQNGKFPVVLPVAKENGVSDKGRTSNGGPPQDAAFKPISLDAPNDVTEVVIEPPSKNGLSSAAPVNGKPPRQNGTTANKVKVVAGVIPPAVPRTPVYLEKSVGDS